jgi:hypothetical protein
MNINQVENKQYGAKTLELINVSRRKNNIRNNKTIMESKGISELDPGE